MYFHNYITNPQPNFITEWRQDVRKEHWYHKLANGILIDVESSLACVLYHYDRLIELETSVIEGIQKYNYQQIIPNNSAIGIGNTKKWDFEYQAFILSYRRCLDYLARSICTYFMNDFNSYRRLGSFLNKINRPTITNHLIEIHTKYFESFEFVLSEGNRKSLRDRISHYEYLSVGAINLTSQGLILVGGADELGIGENQNTLLSQVLETRVTNLQLCIRELIHAFVDGMRNDQELQKSKTKKV